MKHMKERGLQKKKKKTPSRRNSKHKCSETGLLQSLSRISKEASKADMNSLMKAVAKGDLQGPKRPRPGKPWQEIGVLE